VSIAALQALQTALQNAITASAAAKGGSVLTNQKMEASEALVWALRQVAAYIQSLTPTLTVSQVLTSGFDVVSTGGTPAPLDQPVFALDNSVSGQLGVNLTAVPNAKAYQVQYCTGTGAWLEAGIYPNTKGIVLLNLTPGTIYNVRLRAIGGSTQYSPWSITVSLMAT
jgi:hypothetical protein